MLEIISIVSTVVMIVLIGIVLKLPDLITQKWLETIKNKMHMIFKSNHILSNSEVNNNKKY